MKTFFEYYLEDKNMDVLNNLNRFNGLRTIKNETVAHHSYHVTLFSRVLAIELGIKDSDLLLRIMDYALLHDAEEAFDFDVNHTVKYNEYNGVKIRELLSDYTRMCIIKRVDEGLNSYFLNNCDDAFVKMLVKIADWMSCVFYLNKERKLGNTGINEEYERSLKALDCAIGNLQEFMERGSCRFTVGDYGVISDLRKYVLSKLIEV